MCVDLSLWPLRCGTWVRVCGQRFEDCARIPAQGRLLIVANHPSGALDALALLDLVGQVRRDVRIVANDVFYWRWMVWVDCCCRCASWADSLRWTACAQWRRPWRVRNASLCFQQARFQGLAQPVFAMVAGGGFCSLLSSCDAPVLPVRVQARNSALFYGIRTVQAGGYRAAGARNVCAPGPQDHAWVRHAHFLPMRMTARYCAIFATSCRRLGGEMPPEPDRPEPLVEAIAQFGHTDCGKLASAWENQ